ncbi:MAG: beta-ketoacyl-ACP synthase III, partial [Pseudomonadales bacterium]
MKSENDSVVISGTGLFTPEESISNEELVLAFNQYVAAYNAEHATAIAAEEMAALQESSVEFIDKASGIGSRYVMDKTGILDPQRMCPSIPERPNEEQSLLCEMSVAAARQAMQRAGKAVADIDAVIVACSNLQRPYPAIAVEVQDALGIDGFAYDMNVACSSATFGMQAASNSIQSGSARAVLMVNPEVCAGHLNFRDRDSHFIFGDACTAVVLESSAQCTSDNAYLI